MDREPGNIRNREIMVQGAEEGAVGGIPDGG